MSSPLVTILTPAYNAKRYIGEAIRSALTQTFNDFELLIVDDGSTDGTVAAINDFTDPRIRLIRQEHKGIAVALNQGLQEARGSFIARFDADDICMPERLKKQLEFLHNNPSYILCGSDAEYISETGEHLFHFRCAGYTHDEIMHHLPTDCPFIHSAVMYRKEHVLKLGGYSLNAHNFEDYLLWVQLSKHGLYANLNEQLIKVRFNPASVTIDEKWRGSRFRKLKSDIINRGHITTIEGEELLTIIKQQNTRRIKQGAYYALCGKKFLLNNHQPAKARTHLARAIYHYPFRLDNYFLYMLSYFPFRFIDWLHKKSG